MRSPLLWLALLLHLSLAGTYAARTPAFEGPDENGHYEYAWFLANKGSLPLSPAVAKERGLPQTAAAVLAHHPPLYYAMLAAVLVGSGRSDTLFAPLGNPEFQVPQAPARFLHFRHEPTVAPLLVALRWVSVLLGAVSVACVFAFGRILCPERPVVAGVAAIAVASLPMWSFLHGVLNSDVLAVTTSSLALVLLARAQRSGAWTMRSALALGVALGLAWSTKTTTLFLGAIALHVAAATWLRAAPGPARRGVLVRWLVAAGVALLVSGWVFVRNWATFGDPFAMHAHDEAFAAGGVSPDLVRTLRWPYLLGPLYFGDTPLPPAVPTFVPTVFTSLLGRFGWFSCPPAGWLVVAGAATVLLAVVGLVRSAFDEGRALLPRPLGLSLLACALVLLGTAWFNATAMQPQGRLLLPAVAPAAVLLAAGLVRATAFLPRRGLLLAAPPAVAIVVYVGTFAPAFDPALAKAPVEHRSLVGEVVDAQKETIRWSMVLPSEPLAAPPTLRWRDEGAAAGTRYTLYAFDQDGAVWLATHEWTGGAVVVAGDAFVVPDAVWQFVPAGRPMSFRLRRLPTSHDDDVALLPATPPLPFTRR
jgi:hypothetical protein